MDNREHEIAEMQEQIAALEKRQREVRAADMPKAAKCEEIRRLSSYISNLQFAIRQLQRGLQERWGNGKP